MDNTAFGEEIISFIYKNLRTKEEVALLVGLDEKHANFAITVLLGQVVGHIERKLYRQTT